MIEEHSSRLLFQEYRQLLEEFHRALVDRDASHLQPLLSRTAKISVESSGLVPLSDDIDVVGISLEGNGEIVAVQYVCRAGERAVNLVAYLRREGDALRIEDVVPRR